MKVPAPKPTHATPVQLVFEASSEAIEGSTKRPTTAKEKSLKTRLAAANQERKAAEALVRKIATAVIQKNRALWSDLKSRLEAHSRHANFGSDIHLMIGGAVAREMAGRTTPELDLLKGHLTPLRESARFWTPSDAVTAEIFRRAAMVAGRC